MAERKRQPFTPKGISLSVLDQVEKMGCKAWAGGIRINLNQITGRWVAHNQIVTCLKRLVEHGLIERCGEEKSGAGGNFRKYYRITAEGRAKLEDAMNLYQGFVRRPDMYDQAAS